jgi:leader peptidase (prepilin peptidase)/N-methyltransferase
MMTSLKTLGPVGATAVVAATIIAVALATAALCRPFQVRPRWAVIFAGASALTFSATALSPTPFELNMALVLGVGLWALALIDLSIRRLPDALTLPLLVVGLFHARSIDSAQVPDHVLGAVVGFGGFAAIAWLYRRVRHRDGLGLGDAKFLAVAGAWLGWRALPLLILLACLVALLWIVSLRLRGATITGSTSLALGPPMIAALWFLHMSSWWRPLSIAS